MNSLTEEVIMNTLRKFRIPVSIAQIVSRVAGEIRSDPQLVEEAVIATIKTGLKQGFIRRYKRLYYAPTLSSLNDDWYGEDPFLSGRWMDDLKWRRRRQLSSRPRRRLMRPY